MASEAPPDPEDPSVAALAAAITDRLGGTAAQARRALDAVLASVRDRLLEAGQVTLPDFATLRLGGQRSRPASQEPRPAAGDASVASAPSADAPSAGGSPVTLTPTGALREAIERAQQQTIALAVPRNDTFAEVIVFHFSRHGWNVQLAHDAEGCLQQLMESGANLAIVDFTLPDAQHLVEEIRCRRALSSVPVIALYADGFDPDRPDALVVRPDEHLVEPFEVYTLLMLAESELARADGGVAEAEHAVDMALPTREDACERCATLCGRLLYDTGLDEEAQVGLQAALREALANAAQHGHADDPTKAIRVRYRLTAEEVALTVVDKGRGFDHAALLGRQRTQDAVEAARERHREGRPGGLGVMLMTRCTDRLDYNAAGNAVTLRKRRPS